MSTVQEEYEEKLKKAMEAVSDEEIANRFPWQSRMATMYLLNHALPGKKDVSMISGSCSKGFYNEVVLKAMEDCSKAGCRMRFLVWSPTASSIAPGIFEMAQRRLISLRIFRVREQDSVLPHFLLVGDRAYRQEAAHESFAGREFTEYEPEIPARICFNDVSSGAVLSRIFETLWEISAEGEVATR